MTEVRQKVSQRSAMKLWNQHCQQWTYYYCCCCSNLLNQTSSNHQLLALQVPEVASSCHTKLQQSLCSMLILTSNSFCTWNASSKRLSSMHAAVKQNDMTNPRSMSTAVRSIIHLQMIQMLHHMEFSLIIGKNDLDASLQRALL